MSELLTPDAPRPMRPYAAAKAFQLPENWQEGRGPVIDILAVDPEGALDVDDGMRFDGENGEGELYIGVADLSVLWEEEFLLKTAEKRKRTIYGPDGHAIRPMFPRPISENKLSLRDGEVRPAVGIHIPVDSGGIVWPPRITYDAVRAKQISYNEADALTANGNASPGALALRGIVQVTQNLHAARLPRSRNRSNFLVQNEDGQIIGTRGEVGSSHFMVPEAMITANMVMGRLMRENRIPRINRACLLGDIRLVDLGSLPDALDSQLLRAFWTSESLGHVALNTLDYAQFTSGLRRFGDVVNHLNVAAFYKGEPFPYPEDRTSPLGVRLTGRVRKPTIIPGAAPRPKTRKLEQARDGDIMGRIEKGTASPTDLTAAIFNPEENETTISQAQAAVRYITRDATMANSVIGEAKDTGLITFRPATPEDNAGSAPMVAEYKGKVYPYDLSEIRLLAFHTNTRLLGAIAGLSPEESRPVAAKLRRPSDYMMALRKQGVAVYRNQCLELDEDAVTCRAHVYVYGRLHSADGIGRRLPSAEDDAAMKLVERLNLYIEPPTEKLPEEEHQAWRERLLRIEQEPVTESEED